jgi:hypothetical protein
MEECFMCAGAAGDRYTLEVPAATYEKTVICDTCAGDLRDTEWLDIRSETGTGTVSGSLDSSQRQ